jgi:hypothetical protein
MKKGMILETAEALNVQALHELGPWQNSLFGFWI